MCHNRHRPVIRIRHRLRHSQFLQSVQPVTRTAVDGTSIHQFVRIKWFSIYLQNGIIQIPHFHLYLQLHHHMLNHLTVPISLIRMIRSTRALLNLLHDIRCIRHKVFHLCQILKNKPIFYQTYSYLQ